MNKPVGQEVEEEEKMDEAVSLYFAGQSLTISTWEKLRLGGMRSDKERFIKVFRGSKVNQ